LLAGTREEAEAKRRETERVHEEFKAKLEHRLRTDEQIWEPFAQVIKEMFPKSSKRGSRQQSRLRAARTRP
jgi:ribosomal protein L13